MFTSANNTVTRLIAAIVDFAKTRFGLFTSLSTYCNEIVNLLVSVFRLIFARGGVVVVWWNPNPSKKIVGLPLFGSNTQAINLLGIVQT